MDELEGILEHARTAPLSEEGHNKLKAALETLDFVTRQLEKKQISIARLRNLLFGPASEKTEKVFPDASEPDEPEVHSDGEEAASEEGPNDEEKKKKKGHGRNGASAYEGAEKIEVAHHCLKPGHGCPGCKKGKVYRLKIPRVLVRIIGQAPLQARVCELEQLRCNLCGEIFTAKAPEGMGEKKYDETSASMIALLKYGSGLPFNRLAKLEGNVGIPLPAATQWDIVHERAGVIAPVYTELIRQAAQGEVVHNDDTNMKILEFMGKRRESEQEEDAGERTGIFTSGIVSVGEGQRIALFFTGRKHAGENLTKVLRQRAGELKAPIQMCDALSRNLSRECRTIVANCLAHSRRKFVDVAGSFPSECRYVLKTLKKVYRNDALARRDKLSPQERLEFHRARSAPLMEKLEEWLLEQLEERHVEPNSGLGEAITYMLNHWKKLTLFLHEPGAPLDNNICERALKKAILHRKNALFYRSERGARVGDLFMSLIHTCELSGVSPFDYLNELQRHAAELEKNPHEWMPWNYRDTLRGLAAQLS